MGGGEAGAAGGRERLSFRLEVRDYVTKSIRKRSVRYMFKGRTVNDEDISGASINVRHIDEVDVILSQSHDGRVAASVGSAFDIVPAESRAASGSLSFHVQVKQLAVRHGVYDMISF